MKYDHSDHKLVLVIRRSTVQHIRDLLADEKGFRILFNISRKHENISTG